MPAPAVITLLTDFGLRDPFVGTMRGVIAGIIPRAQVIDISHDVEPQNVRQGGWFWRQAAPYFPPGTVHVGVVDPGVGSERRILAARTREAVFLAPDNGMIGLAIEKRALLEAVWVVNPRYFLRPVSRTFHGRDVFAPVAARLAKGLPLSRLGPSAEDYRWLSMPEPRRAPPGGPRTRKGKAAQLAGEIIDIDRFGNCLTNLRLDPAVSLARLQAGRLRLTGLSTHYAAAAEGETLAVISSSGYLEIAVYRGRADRRWRLQVGDAVVATLL